MKSIFIGPKGLRSGWRFLIFIGLLALFSSVARWLFLVSGYVSPKEWEPVDFIFSEFADLAVALAAALIMNWIIERRRFPFSAYGISFNRFAMNLLLRGLLYGLLAPAAILVCIYLMHGASFAGFALHGKELAYFTILWGIAMFGVGISEEFVFRGYPLFTLADGFGFWPASIFLSILFGALHYFTKPMETWLDALNVALIGLFLCLTLRRTGNLWFAIGFHAMFDFAALVLFAAPNTGNNGQSVKGHILNVSYDGPAWLTGGPAGIEASVFALVAFLALFPLFRVKKSAPFR